LSIEQTDVVDFIGTDKATGLVILTISDHLDWSDEHEHLSLLQEKINTYLRFIENGELVESYAGAKDRQAMIEIVGQYGLPDEAMRFMGSARAILEEAGIQLNFRQLNIGQHPGGRNG
jgi:hypothetical protein